jgi:hypothetical protein
MANTLLTPTMILREAGRLFHQKSKFLKSINRTYDDQFAKTGGKVGYSIQLRDRNEFTVTTGATLVTQNVTETTQTLTVNTQKHVGMNFSSADITMVIDDFSKRYIEPAMAILVANIESDALISMANQVGNFVDNDAAAFSFLNVAQAKQKLDESLTPEDGQRTLLLCPTHATKYLDATKGLFTPTSQLGQQYKDGMVKDMLGNDVMSTTHMTAHNTGTAAKVTGYTVNGANQIGAAITVQTGTTTFLIGDVVTFAGCNAVHQETKADLGYLKQFSIIANSGASATSLAIRPAITATGAKQNVTASPTDTGAVVKVGAGASETYTQSMVYHKDAFIFGSVDLEDMSKYGGWGARDDFDGVSMRIWRQGDIVNDNAPCRIDVLYGFLARYPKMACRIHADG